MKIQVTVEVPDDGCKFCIYNHFEGCFCECLTFNEYITDNQPCPACLQARNATEEGK